MKNILISILGGFLLAMILETTHVTVSVSEIVKPHYDRFIKLAKECKVPVNESELRIEIDYMNPRKRYYAVTYPTLSIISVNYRKYMWLSEIEKEQVILHELGHALLDLDHEDEDLNLMNATGFIPERTYIDNYDYFIRKLFKDCKKPLVGKFVHGSN